MNVLPAIKFGGKTVATGFLMGIGAAAAGLVYKSASDKMNRRKRQEEAVEQQASEERAIRLIANYEQARRSREESLKIQNEILAKEPDLDRVITKLQLILDNENKIPAA